MYSGPNSRIARIMLEFRLRVRIVAQSSTLAWPSRRCAGPLSRASSLPQATIVPSNPTTGHAAMAHGSASISPGGPAWSRVNHARARPNEETAFTSMGTLPDPGTSTEVTTYFPLGETCDMKPKRCGVFSVKSLHLTTYSLLMELTFWRGSRAHSALLLLGPSTSSPSVFPSRETEWQLAQVGNFCMTVLLWSSSR